jgi:hypothetical protein
MCRSNDQPIPKAAQLNSLLKPKLILEYAIIDSMGRNKGWHMHGFINSLDDLPVLVNDIKIQYPNKQVKTKIYEYTTAFGSVQIA